MSSLKDAVATAEKSKTTESTSGKTPAYYAKQKQSFIDEACESPVMEVRIHSAASEFTPVGNLKKMMVEETEKDVLSMLLQNSNIPNKSLKEFLDSDRMDLFQEEDDAYQAVLARVGKTDDAKDDTSEDAEDGAECTENKEMEEIEDTE